MAELQVVFHRLAAKEYRSARNWYAERSSTAAAQFRTAVDQAVGRILADREVLPKLGNAYRWVRVSRFPYILIFREQAPGAVMIMAVAHTSRRPGYWSRRG